MRRVALFCIFADLLTVLKEGSRILICFCMLSMAMSCMQLPENATVHF